MSQRRLLGFLLLGGALGVAQVFALWPRAAPAAQPAKATSSAGSIRPAVLAPVAPPLPSPASALELLPALHIVNQTSRESRDVKLYGEQGTVDEARAVELDALLCDARLPGRRETTRINRRTLQLLFKAAYHFGSPSVEIVSAYRRPGRRREGPHGTGDAIDFRLVGVRASELAAYLRRIPRTGVGVYTHPKTQFVHLDSREHSFHWLDASPPNKRWREKSIGGSGLPALDRSYTSQSDWPDELDLPKAAGGR